MIEELRAGIKNNDPKATGREAATSVRREMPNRGLADAEGRGDSARAEKYRKAIAEMPETSLKVRENAGKIVLESVAISDTFTTDERNLDERNPNIQTQKGEMGPNKEPDEGRIALNIRAASKDVYAGWTTPDGSGDEGEISERAIEAQISAAVKGRKPLYFEPWGDGLSDLFAESYRKVIPANVEVVSKDGMLFVYRPEAVQPIIDSDPAFYKIGNESLLDSIARVSAAGRNGELLGYGARDILTRPSHGVTILRGKQPVLYYFVSDPDPVHAGKFAKDRANDFVRAFGWSDVRFEIEKLEC